MAAVPRTPCLRTAVNENAGINPPRTVNFHNNVLKAAERTAEPPNSIQTFLRIRPYLPKLDANDTSSCIRFDGDSKIVSVQKSEVDKQVRLKPKAVLESTDDQAAAFKQVVEDQLQPNRTSVFMCYGLTGSGKTHTIFGDAQQTGMIFRTIEHMFAHSGATTEPATLRVRLIELYMDQIFSLEEDSKKEVEHTKIGAPNAIAEHEPLTYKGSEAAARSIRKIIDSQRETAQNCTHERSSRSHLIIELSMVQTEQTYVFIDLAGSEALSGDAKINKEGQKIRSSLTSLGTLIRTLSDKGSIAGRDCTLTRMVSHYIVQGGQVSVVGCVAAKSSDYSRTLTVVEFMQNVKRAKVRNIIQGGIASAKRKHNARRQTIDATPTRLLAGTPRKLTDVANQKEIKRLTEDLSDMQEACARQRGELERGHAKQVQLWSECERLAGAHDQVANEANTRVNDVAMALGEEVTRLQARIEEADAVRVNAVKQATSLTRKLQLEGENTAKLMEWGKQLRDGYKAEVAKRKAEAKTANEIRDNLLSDNKSLQTRLHDAHQTIAAHEKAALERDAMIETQQSELERIRERCNQLDLTNQSVQRQLMKQMLASPEPVQPAPVNVDVDAMEIELALLRQTVEQLEAEKRATITVPTVLQLTSPASTAGRGVLPSKQTVDDDSKAKVATRAASEADPDLPPTKRAPRASRTKKKSMVVETADAIMNDVMPTSPFATKAMEPENGTISKAKRVSKRKRRGLASVLDGATDGFAFNGSSPRTSAPRLKEGDRSLLRQQANGVRSLFDAQAAQGPPGTSAAGEALLEEFGVSAPRPRRSTRRQKPRLPGRHD